MMVTGEGAGFTLVELPGISWESREAHICVVLGQSTEDKTSNLLRHLTSPRPRTGKGGMERERGGERGGREVGRREREGERPERYRQKWIGHL